MTVDSFEEALLDVRVTASVTIRVIATAPAARAMIIIGTVLED